MASTVRATMLGNRSPSHRSSHLMTNSGHGPSIFASITTEDGDGEDRAADAEVRNINSFYSPLNASSDSLGQNSPVVMDDQLPRGLIVPNPQDPVEENLRRKCAFFFMDPVQKFIARRQAPWKLILQFAKIFLITAQLLIFGQFRYAHTNYYNDNHVAFEHLFLNNWDSAREINAYPPATGKYALYKKDSFYGFFNYAANTFASLQNITLVPMVPNSTLDFCVESYVPIEGATSKKENLEYCK